MDYIIGERVRRRSDSRDGVVEGAREYNGQTLYTVRLSRPAETVQGFASAWSPAITIHAHGERVSQDCDGQYSSGWLAEPTSEERRSGWEMDFKGRVVRDIVNTETSSGRLDVTEEGVTWSETTEEGFVSVTVTWCSDQCSDSPWSRDHTAERAGY